jgi:tRNA pseudouridine13 synthase
MDHVPLSLLTGPRHFQVSEVPAYLPSGDGEHLYVEIEKEGLTTDAVAQALAKVCGKRDMDVGYAGRKDRHAITRQWFSVHFGKEENLAQLAGQVRNGRLEVLQVGRHRNKLRLGHCAGNRFRLGLGLAEGGSAPIPEAVVQQFADRLQQLHRDGLRNVFGPQRFGVQGATLAIAVAWGRGDHAAAVERIVDPSGAWHLGEVVPDRWYGGPEGRVVAALRRNPQDPGRALRSCDDRYRKLVASAAQSAVFNAVLEARVAAGCLHRLRVGDLGCNAKGAPFLVTDEELDSTNARCSPGVLDAFATAPLPGTTRLKPAAAIHVEEQAWSAATGIDWSWFDDGGAFTSPGERRPVVVPFREVPSCQVDGSVLWVQIHLPSGSYATSALSQAGVVVPVERRDG